MSEYCEYMWDTTRGHMSPSLARSIYEEEARFDKCDKKLAIKTVRAILREMPDVDLKHCTDEYITRFLLARKYRTEQAAALIAAYQAQVAHRQDIFGNLTARDPALQRALRAGIPGVLPARDRKGRCVLVILASQWDPIAVPALSVQRALFLVLEILIQDPRNQQSGFVAVVDWSGFSLRQGGALGAAALRNLIAALRGRFPARFKAIHFLSAPLYVQATLALVKPFLDEKTRNKIYLHGNNLSTLHEHLPTDILPAELGGTGPAFNPGLWAEPVIHSAMKEAELAAIKKEKEQAENADQSRDKKFESRDMENHKRNEADSIKSNNGVNKENGRRFFNPFGNSTKNQSPKKPGGTNVELNLINRTNGYAERKEDSTLYYDTVHVGEDIDYKLVSSNKNTNNQEINMKKSPSKNQGKSDDTETKDIREKMEEIDVKPSSSTNSMKNPALLPSGVGQMKQLQEAKMVNQTGPSSSGSATGNPRNKTALAPGHSLMDWIRLGNSGVDLTGVGGVPRVVTLSELATHNKQNDAWIAIRGIVFNVTRYMDFHPGGVNELMRGVGKDATKLFENVHAWVNYQSILQKCVVGRLSRGSVSGTSSPPTENVASSTSNCSSATVNQITSCTTHGVSQENMSDTSTAKIKMDWRQTSNSLTLFYQTMRNYPGTGYQLSTINDSKLIYKLFFTEDILTHELELTGKIQWPPVCVRNFETMEISCTFMKHKKEIWKSYGNQAVYRETNTHSRIYREYEVLTNKPLSKLVHLLVVRAKDFLQIVPVGRHVEAKMNIMGMEVSRMYTPVPPCLHPDDMAPNYKSDCLCLMIKNYPNGAFSPSITALQIGQTFLLSNALGAFIIECFDHYSNIHMIVGGTGLTVMLGIIQRALARRNVMSINLLNFNKDEDNMFYAKEMEKATIDKRLKVTHILSNAGDAWTGRRGTLSDNLLKELVGTNNHNACVFTCGPRGFLLVAKESLLKFNWKPHQMYEFND